MKMNSLVGYVRTAVLGLCASVAFCCAGASAAVRPAVWTDSYRAARAYAERNNVPLLVYYGSTDCGASNFFISDVLESDEFNAWLSRHPIVLVRLHASDEVLKAARQGTEETSPYPEFFAARTWIKSVAKSINQYPFLGLYWKRSNGSVVQQAFTGRSGSIPSVSGSGAKGQLEKMIALLDKQFGKYTGGVTPDPVPTYGIVDIDTLPTYDVQTRNNNLYAVRTFHVPLKAMSEETGLMLVAGLLTVTEAANGKLSATYEGSVVKKFKFSGAWDRFNLTTDAGLAEMSDKNGAQLRLELSKKGVLSAELDIPFGYSSVYGTLSGSALHTVATSSYYGFYGLYTVALMDFGNGLGSGSLTLNVSKTGKVTWKGTMADGSALNGSALLQLNLDGTASLPIFKKSSKYIFSAELVISGDDVCNVADTLVWHSAASDSVFTAYGRAFEKGLSPRKAMARDGLSEPLTLRIGGKDVVELTTSTSGFQFNRKNGLLSAFSYASATGVFTGKAKIDVNGRSVTGAIKGVLLFGSDRSFGYGTFYVRGLSLPVELAAR